MVSIDDLKASNFFRDLEEVYFLRIAKLCREETFKAQDIIVNEGDEAKKIYVLNDGSIAIQVHLKKYQYVIISTIEEKGELFGWSALVEPKRYSATVKCLSETRVLSISGEELDELFKNDPVMGLTFMKKIASLIDQRLITMRSRLVSSVS